jgi:thymidylate synthase (FAD)
VTPEQQTRYELLDHGYLKPILSWGSDQEIVETARMSTDKGFLGWEPEFEYVCPRCDYSCKLRQKHDALFCSNLVLKSSHPGDAKLLAYLYTHKHSTPFEFAGLTIECQAPIMVYREWHRHRTQAYSEMSARYVEMPDLFYVPSVERLMMQPTASRQTGGRKIIETAEEAEHAQQSIRDISVLCRHQYLALLDRGVSRELARGVLPVYQYSRMRATANLRNWLAFLTLRMDPAAQWEIRQYANVVGGIIAERFPRTWELFAEGRPA